MAKSPHSPLPSPAAVERLRPFLDDLLRRYHQPGLLASDPVQFVHRYREAADQEVAGLLAALFAFGNVGAIHRSLERLLGALGPEPGRALSRESFRAPLPAGFCHRWVTAEDTAGLLRAIGRVVRQWGSLGALAGAAYERHGSLGPVLGEFAGELAAALPGAASPGQKFLLASPSSGSASKRLALYFRWMVRRDEIDVGLWENFIPRHALKIPLDTHLSRIVRYIGLTRRQTVNWKMAEEVTAALARLDPEDPVRFDFALARLGILRDCPHRRQANKCAPCPIQRVCRLGRGVRPRAGESKSPGLD